ncbi:hypothetical protein [Rhodoferax sp.]|uniref:hypothetical protein n=1 Tax=Rhodoferax sp. TaxID=50421 RepID=UPI002844A5D4|nr:hypothetical protein [Rhodoferax sp.]MDR3370388.1 hypothetical protein [Rhodoferax sp.]
MRHFPSHYFFLPLLAALVALPWETACGTEKSTVPEIEYASPDQSVWTTRVNHKGEPENPLLRVAAVLFAKAGIPWHSRRYPAARMFKSLQDGSAQFSMLVKSPHLQACCLLSRKPITSVEVRAYHLGGRVPINGVNDLVNKNIISIHGYSYGGLLGFLNDEHNHISNNLAPTHLAAFRMLAQQRADYVIDYVGPATEVLAAVPLLGLQSEVVSSQDVYLVLNKNYPDATRVMARLEAIADTLDVDRVMRPTNPR